MTQNNYRPEYVDPSRRHEEITPELIDYYIRYGNHLRAAMMATWISGLGSRIARLWRPVPVRSQHNVAERFANSLAALRSSAETLRDAGDLSAAERARFVSVVLEEEARLEALLTQLPTKTRALRLG